MGDDLTFIGTATTLLRLGPFTLLTDPNFLHRGERAHLGYGLTSKRLTDPAMGIDELPPLDAIVLSHRHGDHWDRRAKDGLDRGLPVVTTPHAADRLSRKDGFTAAVGLRTWEEHTLTKDGCSLVLRSAPAVHSTNALLRRLLPPVMGTVLDLHDAAGERVRRIYVTGDTMLFDGIDEVASRCPDIDVAVVHAGGATLPGGFVVTMTGGDAIECLSRLRPRAAVPIHYDDYRVFRSGLEDVKRAADHAYLDVDLRYVDRGDTVSLK